MVSPSVDSSRMKQSYAIQIAMKRVEARPNARLVKVTPRLASAQAGADFAL